MKESKKIARGGHVAKEYWIETVFKRRECIKPITARGDVRCGCGRLAIDHRYASRDEGIDLAAGELGAKTQTSQNGLNKWHPAKNTCTLPTDAFGQIEFQGDAHPNKAQYVRLDYMTPPEHVLELLLNHWKLQLPRLLISVHGGISNFDLQPKLKRVFRKGLIRAAHTTGAWIITGGTTTGVMKHVGEALSERSAKSNRKKNIVAIGITPWGVISERGELIAKDACIEYHASAYPRRNMAVLNSSHNYFLLADNGSHRKYGAEIALRKRLERYISQQKISSRGEKPVKGVPIVCIVLEGGSNIIRTVLDYVTDTPAVPVVVCDGSGRASDLLAFAHKYSAEDGQLPDALKDQLISAIQKTFSYSAEQASALYDELVLCMKRKEMIAVFRMGEQVQDVDLAILTALLKSHHMDAPQQLSLALAWDRVDLARNHIFTYRQEWPEDSLEQALMDALIHDRVEFVQLLLDKGVNMTHFLTFGRLEELYNTKVGQTITLNMMLNDLRKNKVPGARVTLLDVGLIMNKLMGGAYRSSYSRRKFKTVYHEIMKLACTTFPFLPRFNEATQASHTFEYPFSELMVWAVLLKRQAMAKFLWQQQEEALAKAIIASNLYRSLYKEALEDALVDNVIAMELMDHSREFQQLALDFLDYVYKQDDDMAQQLLTYELKNWSGQTCLSLAYSCGMREFIAHTCCQNLITDMWMGGLRMNKNHNIKVFVAILLPPIIPFLGYKSQSELQHMPQTVEEHIHDLERIRDSMRSGSGSYGNASADQNFSRGSRRISLSGLSQADFVADQSVEDGQEVDNDLEAPNVVTWLPVGSMTPSTSTRVFSADRIVTRRRADPTAAVRSGPTIAFTKKSKHELHLSTKVYEFYSAPITKFWLHTIAYLFFLGTLSYTVLVRLDQQMVHWTEVYTMAYIFFHTTEMIRQIAIAESPKLSQKLRIFFQEKWNIIDAVAVPVFWIGAGLRFQPDEVTFLWGHVVYSLDTICWFVRILELFQVSRQLGPFVVIIEKLVNNIVNLVAFWCVVIWAFGVPRQAILNPYAEPEWILAKNIMMEPYFMFYGELFTDKLDPDCGTGTNWICWPGRWLVPLIMTIYLLASYALLMNLLIAVFNYTFNALNANSMQIWMYQCYGLMHEYEIKPLLPPPFVALNHLFFAFKSLHRRLRRKPGIQDFGLKLFLCDLDIRKLHDFEEDCLGDFFLNMQIKHESSTDERIRVTSEKVDSIIAKIDDVNQKQSLVAGAFSTLEFRNSILETLAVETNTMLFRIHETLLLPQSPVLPKGMLRRTSDGDSLLLSRTASVDEQSESTRGTLSSVRNHECCSPRRSSTEFQPTVADLPDIMSAANEQPLSALQSNDSGAVQFLIRNEHFNNTIDRLATYSTALPIATVLNGPRGMLDNVTSGSDGLASTQPLALQLHLPPATIMQQQEYSSITDTIDVSCLHNASPIHSPKLSRKRLTSVVSNIGYGQSSAEPSQSMQSDQHIVEEITTNLTGGSPDESCESIESGQVPI